jgi:hypothetical protein
MLSPIDAEVAGDLQDSDRDKDLRTPLVSSRSEVAAVALVDLLLQEFKVGRWSATA